MGNVDYLECGRYRNDRSYRKHQCQNFAQTCLRQPSFTEEDLAFGVVLGAPRDEKNPNFKLFATCPSSNARQHTMAQSTIDFQNDCGKVSKELQARANGQ